MEILLDVVRVEAGEDFTLLLEFENGQRRRFDFAPYLDRPPFLPLRRKALFLQGAVENGTVVWPGNLDIAPETLWDCSVPVEE